MEASFSALIFSFATAALMNLGLEKNPGSGEFEKNLDLAQLNIDWLVILKEKTNGNLSSEESNYLNSIVTDLQMKFVQAK